MDAEKHLKAVAGESTNWFVVWIGLKGPTQGKGTSASIL